MDNSPQLSKHPKDLVLKEYTVFHVVDITQLHILQCFMGRKRHQISVFTLFFFHHALLMCIAMLCKYVIIQDPNGQIFPTGVYKGATHTKQCHQRHSTGGNGLLMTGVLGANLTSHFFHRVLATLSNGPCHCTA